jgi:putative oxidoreductase
MVMFGYQTRIGAVLLIAFLVPVTFTMHNFWAIHEAGERQMQMINFMKNLSMLGGALIISYFGAGPLSVDEWLRTRVGGRAPAPKGLTPTAAT